MTPKEKAEELLKKFDVKHTLKLAKGRGLPVSMYDSQIKECALIAVDEIIKAHIHNEGVRHLKWWEEVKHEIEKL